MTTINPHLGTLEFVVYGPPKPAGSKVAGISRAGSVFVRDSTGRSGAEWRRTVSQVAGNHMKGLEPLPGPIVLDLRFWLPRPKSHFGKRGLLPSAPSQHLQTPDLLKLARAVEDALTGIVYRDDSQIVAESLQKMWGEPARVQVQIEQLEQLATEEET